MEKFQWSASKQELYGENATHIDGLLNDLATKPFEEVCK